ncbi:sigma-70 family RNA polymerase sigma factor [Rhodobacter sp. KR11]|jgi:RNA polymerase sigma-70 factor (ECF subfamily)|uniref:sigma-70 family RNA polymerase sigma factor n=1 Tax=Rhodobacter sp. KR11 TaxID=2974588 RepID=UPI0022222C6A|nr:sigma-70 family RNA polymerase sigma factor [Rhodobacter sp. KR11]MCW1919495.1 sigma-70 family RNA polymerase sigma factor [Rhodobacter sp. KR11]
MADELTDLLLRVAAQDRTAFRALYSACAPKLMGVLIRMLGNRSQAEDALQEVFTRVWLRAGRFDPERGAALGWMIAIARNHAIDRIRMRHDTTSDDLVMNALPDPAPRAEHRLQAQGEARRITDCFDTLEADRARAIRGAYLDGLSYQDLAQRHDVPLNTMRTWLRRGLMALRECMEQ